MPGSTYWMGEADNDSLYGGAGFDTLVGGGGDDVLQGNFNADCFVFETDHGHDRVLNFHALNSLEVLDFSQLDGFYAVADVLAATHQDGGNLVIETGSDSSIVLLGMDLADFGSDDIVF